MRHTCCNEGLCGTADIMAADLPHPGLGYSLIAMCFPQQVLVQRSIACNSRRRYVPYTSIAWLMILTDATVIMAAIVMRSVCELEFWV